MSKPIRKGAKPLQIRVSGWVHEVIEQRTAVPGVEKWMVVERLMRAGLDAETSARAKAEDKSRPDPIGGPEFGETLLRNLFLRADQYLRTLFAKDVAEFMRTIREVQGDKKSLPASEWRRWAKQEQVPKEYAQTVFTLLRVLDGVCRTEDAYINEKLRTLGGAQDAAPVR